MPRGRGQGGGGGSIYSKQIGLLLDCDMDIAMVPLGLVLSAAESKFPPFYSANYCPYHTSILSAAF